MNVTREELLQQLPPYRDEWLVIKEKQRVKDIIREMMDSYPEFMDDYDKICSFFIGHTIYETCENLFKFCTKNIRYIEEGEDAQISSLPTGILVRGYGDCKTYAQFIGGCLGAITRTTGEKIDWSYCFVSYELMQRTPYHVFVAVNTADGPYWVDPTPTANEKTPVWEEYHKPYETVGYVVTGAGSLVAADSMGAITPTQSVEAGSLPLPDGYPAGLPQPHIVNGKLQLTPVPPNFEADATQIAWMLIALQLWVYAYSPEPYNVFTYNSKTDGRGVSMADFVRVFCKYYQNPAYYQNGQYIYPQIWGNTEYLAVLGVLKTYPGDMNFLKVPAPVDPTSADKLTDIFKIGFGVVLGVVSSVVPGVGKAFINQWLRELGKTGNSTLLQSDVMVQAGMVIQQEEVAQEEKKKNNLLLYGGIAAAVLLLWWYLDDE